MNIIKITADTRQRNTMSIPTVVQNDTLTFTVKIQENSKDITLDTNATCTLTTYLPSDVSVLHTGERTSDNEITFRLSSSALNQTGIVKASIQIYQNQGRLSTLEFSYNVVRDLSSKYDIPEEENEQIELIIVEGLQVIQQAKDVTEQAYEAIDAMELGGLDLSNYAKKEELSTEEQRSNWDSKETVKGSQAKADEALLKISEHAKRQDAHGLRDIKVEIGKDAEASGDKSIAIGGTTSLYFSTIASGTNSIAIGADTEAQGYDAVAIGSRAEAQGFDAFALGSNANAMGSDAVALGSNANAMESDAVALGEGTEAKERSTVALGSSSKALNRAQGVLGAESQTNEWLVPGSFTVEGTKNFEMPHPHPDKQATHRLRHSAVESPTAGDNLYRYTITTKEDNQTAEYQLPDYFMYLNDDVSVWVNGVGHFGNAYGSVTDNTLYITCQLAGKHNVLVIGTRNDEHQSVQDWEIMGVEREIGQSWRGETYVFDIKEIIEVEEIKEVTNNDNY